MKYATLILPVFIIFIFVYGAIKKVRLYDGFAEGIKGAFPLVVSIFPYLAAIFVMTALLEKSGVSGVLIKILSPAFEFLGIPKEVCPLVLLKPFSGSGSLALLSDIFKTYGADSYISRCASCIFGSSETVFYVSAVYFANCKNKKLFKPVLISLVSTFISCIFACLICRVT